MPKVVSLTVTSTTVAKPNAILQRGAILSFGATTTGLNASTLIGSVADYNALVSHGNVAEAEAKNVLAMVEGYFAQGDGWVYILELGEQADVHSQIAALKNYLTNNARAFAYFCVPPSFASQQDFVTLAANYTAATATTYFFTDAGAAAYNGGLSVLKSVAVICTAPGVINQDARGIPVSTESESARLMWEWVNNTPSATNLATGFCFRNFPGASVWDETQSGVDADEESLKHQNINFLAAGTEAGLGTESLLFWGVMGDGNPMEYWYACSYIVVNIEQVLAAALLQGTQNRQNPLVYNQAGISRLNAVAENFMLTISQYGLIQGDYTVTSIPFETYVAANPEDYANSIYKGLSITVTPVLGLRQLSLGLDVNMNPATTTTSALVTATSAS